MFQLEHDPMMALAFRQDAEVRETNRMCYRSPEQLSKEAKRIEARCFETGDHQPDGTVRHTGASLAGPWRSGIADPGHAHNLFTQEYDPFFKSGRIESSRKASIRKAVEDQAKARAEWYDSCVREQNRIDESKRMAALQQQAKASWSGADFAQPYAESVSRPGDSAVGLFDSWLRDQAKAQQIAKSYGASERTLLKQSQQDYENWMTLTKHAEKRRAEANGAYVLNTLGKWPRD